MSQGWAHTRKWVRGGLILGSGSGVGSYFEVGQGWAQNQKWGGLSLRSGSGVGSYSEVGQGWAHTQKWSGLRLRSGSGVGSYSEVGWAQTQKWVRGGLKLRSGVGSDSKVGQWWAHTQKWGGLRLRSGSGVGSYSELVCFLLCELLHTELFPHCTLHTRVSVTLHVICTVTAAWYHVSHGLGTCQYVYPNHLLQTTRLHL